MLLINKKMQYSNVHHCNRSDDFQLHARESESLLKKKAIRRFDDQ